MREMLLTIYGCAALVAFILAGLAYYDRFNQKKKFRTTVFVFLLILPISGAMFHYFLLPEIILKKAFPSPEGKRLLVAVRKHDPAQYNKLRWIVARNAFKADALEATRREVRKWTDESTKNYLKTAPPEVVAEFSELLFREIEMLRSKDPELCYAVLFAFKDQPREELEKRLDSEFRDRFVSEEMALVCRMIETGSPNYLYLKDPPEVELAIFRAAQKFREKYGAEGVDFISNREKMLADKARATDLLLDFLASVRNEPPRIKGEAFRAILGKGLGG